MNDYSDDLARIHHEGYGDLARSAGPPIVSHFRQAGIRQGLIVDLGCGSGVLARHLLHSGYDVLGVDPSAAMLRIAKRVAPAARFVRCRAEDLELPRCAAVLATGEGFRVTARPPTCDVFSTSVTGTPRCAIRAAVTSPAIPPPMTTTGPDPRGAGDGFSCRWSVNMSFSRTT